MALDPSGAASIAPRIIDDSERGGAAVDDARIFRGVEGVAGVIQRELGMAASKDASRHARPVAHLKLLMRRMRRLLWEGPAAAARKPASPALLGAPEPWTPQPRREWSLRTPSQLETAPDVRNDHSRRTRAPRDARSPRGLWRRKSAKPFQTAKNTRTENTATMAKPDDAVFASTQMVLALPASS